jgi:hypothetical protein
MKLYHIVSGTLFGLVAILHLLRIINQWPLVLGPWSAPISISWVGFIFLTCLSIWSFRLMNNKHK